MLIYTAMGNSFIQQNEQWCFSQQLPNDPFTLIMMPEQALDIYIALTASKISPSFWYRCILLEKSWSIELKFFAGLCLMVDC